MLRADSIEELEQFVRGELDLLVSPLRSPVRWPGCKASSNRATLRPKSGSEIGQIVGLAEARVRKILQDEPPLASDERVMRRSRPEAVTR